MSDFTPAESRVFAQIAAGRTPLEIAQALGIAITTTKTHPAHIFEKTRTTPSAHLVRLSVALAIPLRFQEDPRAAIALFNDSDGFS